jgi:hypothetical protein
MTPAQCVLPFEQPSGLWLLPGTDSHGLSCGCGYPWDGHWQGYRCPGCEQKIRELLAKAAPGAAREEA